MSFRYLEESRQQLLPDLAGNRPVVNQLDHLRQSPGFELEVAHGDLLVLHDGGGSEMELVGKATYHFS